MAKRSRAAAMFAPLALVAMGCSFPLSNDDSTLHEVVFGYHARQPADGRTRRVAAGLDLRTSTLLGGLSLGLDDARILEVPHGGDGDAACDTGFVWPLGLRWRGAEGACRSLGWFAHTQPMPGGGDRAPSFVHQLGVGALVDWNDALQGISVGFSSGTVLRADPDGCGVFILEYRSRAPGHGRLREQKEEYGCD